MLKKCNNFVTILFLNFYSEQHNNQKRHVADIHTKTNSVLNCSNNGCRHGGTNKMSPLVAKPRRRKTRAERNRLRNKTHNKLLHKVCK